MNYHAEILKTHLEDLGIDYLEATVKISPEIRRSRDFDWDEYVSDKQLATLIPARTTGKLILKVKSKTGKELEFGTTTFAVDDPDYYTYAIIPFIEVKDLERKRRRDDVTVVEQLQTVFLVAIEPDQVNYFIMDMHRSGYKLKVRAKGKGCLGVLLALVILLSALSFL